MTRRGLAAVPRVARGWNERVSALVAGALSIFATSGSAAAQYPTDPPMGGQHPGAQVFSLGNEGILIAERGSIVLFDGLFREGVEGYETVPAATLAQLEGRFPNGDGIGIALASHHHPDHFAPESVVAFLSANPDARFVSTRTARTAIEGLGPPSELLGRVVSSYPAEGARDTFDLGPVRVRTLNLHHGRGRPEIQNLGLLVDVEGFRVLHMGDTQVTRDEILAQGIRDDELDAAFVPYWLLLGADGPGVAAAIGARKIFAIHIPRPEAPEGWWGGEGSLEGLVAALERIDGVTALHSGAAAQWIEYRGGPRP